MSWLYDEAKYFKENGKVDILKEASRDFQCLAAELVGNIVYIADEIVEDGKKSVSALVIHTDVQKEDGKYIYGEKPIPEECGPSAVSCPENILKLLTQTDSELANKWRQQCWKNIKKNK